MNVVCHPCARQGDTLKFRITTNESGHVRPATQIIRSEDVAGFESWYQSSVTRFDRHVERIAFHYFRITTSRVSMFNQPRIIQSVDVAEFESWYRSSCYPL